MRLASGEGGRGLTELEVTEADAVQRLETISKLGYGVEHRAGFCHREIERVGDRHPAIADLEGFTVVTSALASFAGDENVWQEVHLDAANTFPLAGFAATALHVE